MNFHGRHVEERVLDVNGFRGAGRSMVEAVSVRLNNIRSHNAIICHKTPVDRGARRSIILLIDVDRMSRCVAPRTTQNHLISCQGFVVLDECCEAVNKELRLCPQSILISCLVESYNRLVERVRPPRARQVGRCSPWQPVASLCWRVARSRRWKYFPRIYPLNKLSNKLVRRSALKGKLFDTFDIYAL